MPKKIYRLDIRDLLYFCLFAGLVVLWFQDAIFCKGIFTYADLGRYFYPIRSFAAESIRAGNIPLWNPYLQNGSPFLAILQSCVFYPISLISYILPSFNDVFNWYILIHFLLASIFMYALMRHWNASRVAGLISGLVFTFGGYLLSVARMNTSLSSVIWLPLIMLFFDKALKRKSIGLAALASIFLAVQFLGGEPTIIYCTLWLLFFYWIGAAFFAYREEGGLRVIKRLAIILFVTFGLWIFLSMVQILPFIELLFNSTRSGPKAFEAITQNSLLFGELSSFFIPYVFGNLMVPGGYLTTQQWLVGFYVGILPLILAACAIILRRGKRIKFLAALFVLSIILALGRYTPIYVFLYKYIAGFGHIRYPIKFIFMASFSLAALAGIGYDAILKIEKNKISIFIKWLLSLTLALGAVIILFLKFRVVLYDQVLSFLSKVMPKVNQNELILVFMSDSAHIVRLFIIFSISALALALFLKKKIRPVIFGFMAASIVFFDLASVNMGIIGVVDKDTFKRIPQNYTMLKEDKSFYRIIRTVDTIKLNRYVWWHPKLCYNYSLGQYDRKRSFVTNIPMAYKFFDSQGYCSIIRDDYNSFMHLIYDEDIPQKFKIAGILNAKYLITTEKIEDDRYQLMVKEKVSEFKIKDEGTVFDDFYIYKNPDSLDRAFLVKRYQVFTDRDAILAVLRDENFDPAELVLLEEEPTVIVPQGGIPLRGTRSAEGATKQSRTSQIASLTSFARNDEGVEIVSYKPEEVIIEVSVNEPKFLVLSDSYYPGWKVFVDGRPDKIYRADYAFRAVYLDSGEHTVKFVYDPASYKVGKYISLSTMLLLLLSGLIARLRRKKLP